MYNCPEINRNSSAFLKTPHQSTVGATSMSMIGLKAGELHSKPPRAPGQVWTPSVVGSVGDRGQGHLVDLLVAFPVDSAQDPILSCNRHHRPACAADHRRVQRVGDGQIPVMQVMGNELPEPLQ